MKALLISPDSQSIEEVEIENMEDIKALIGFDSIESDAIGTKGDRLYFDEDCFIRGTSGRFQVDSVIPVSGKGVIAGTRNNGTTLSSVVTRLDNLAQRIKYL